MRYILFIAISIVISCSAKYDQKGIGEVYIIDSQFRGRVNVIYQQSEGQLEELSNGSRVFRIPNTGILLTQSRMQDEPFEKHYILIDSNGQSLELIAFSNDADNTSNLLGVYRSGTKGIYGNSNDANALRYHEFYISTADSLNNYLSFKSHRAFLNKLDSLTGRNF